MPAEEFQAITGTAKKALTRMAQLDAPFTPDSYAIWHSYYMGQNQALIKELHERVATGLPFTPEIAKEIYDKFFSKEKNAHTIQRVQKEFQAIFRTLLEKIANAGDFTSDYRSKLEAHSERLMHVDDLAGMREIVGEIVQDTDRMAESNRGLEAKIQEATARAEALEQELEAATGRSEQLSQKLEKAQEESLRDSLTKLPNRRAFERKVDEAFEQYAADEEDFALLELDIDYFKKFNDKYGHPVGDEVLRIVGGVLKRCVKSTDFAVRYGGEEFFVLLPDTSLENAVFVGEKIRKLFAEKRFKLVRTGQTVGKITISVGVAAVHPDDTTETLVERTDRALYLAKDSGRNNVKSEADLPA